VEILNILRSATGAVHARIEELPVCRAMLVGEVDREQYTDLLGQLYHLHEQYETEMAASGLAWPNTPSRAAAIARDLKAFDAEIGDVPDTVNEWIDAIGALGHPAAWAGVGYVLEGSRMGSRVLVKSVSKGLGLPMQLGVGLDYHLDAGVDPNGNWRQVMAALVAADEPGSRETIVNAAVATFDAMYALHERSSLVPA
jgi:heme oxygenase